MGTTAFHHPHPVSSPGAGSPRVTIGASFSPTRRPRPTTSAPGATAVPSSTIAFPRPTSSVSGSRVPQPRPNLLLVQRATSLRQLLAQDVQRRKRRLSARNGSVSRQLLEWDHVLEARSQVIALGLGRGKLCFELVEPVELLPGFPVTICSGRRQRRRVRRNLGRSNDGPAVRHGERLKHLSEREIDAADERSLAAEDPGEGVIDNRRASSRNPNPSRHPGVAKRADGSA